MNYLEHNYNNITVYWIPELDGGGRTYGQQFVPVVKNLIGKVDRIHEFCAGPGFIGFSLLAEGLCNSLCLSDINPRAVELLKATVKKNGLEDKVTVILSNGLENIDESAKWDLVVSNPPHFSENVENNILIHDQGWSLHKNFYMNINKHLAPGGNILFQENYFGSKEEDFTEMIENGGLENTSSFMYKIKIEDAVNPYYFLLTRKRNNEIIYSYEPAKIIRIELSHTKYSAPIFNLHSNTKYQFELINKVGSKLFITLRNKKGDILFKKIPFIFLLKDENKSSHDFCLTSGEYDIIDMRNSNIFGKIVVK
jgi:predicted RNA methylase